MHLRQLRSALGDILRFCIDRNVSWWRKLLLGLAALYVLWPFDAVPDFLAPAGWGDDAAILVIAGFWLNRQLAAWRRQRR